MRKINMTFLDLAEKILKEEKRPLNSIEIWNLSVSKGYDKELRSEGKTPWATIAARIYVYISEHKESSLFAITDSRPKKFYLRGVKYKNEDFETDITPQSKKKYTERDLHAFLTYYALYYLKCYTKTINHQRSDKKEYGEWMHPDIVGCCFPIDDWSPEVIELSNSIGNVSIKLISFELKKELNFSNLREAFFQTVSNSSWANESYLVAAEIMKDDDFMNELIRLSGSFGIGIIQLDLEDPDNSQILLPAEPEENLDWETLNKLTMNPDFKDFIKRIMIDITSKEIRKEKYDKVFEKEKLIELINKK